MHLSTWEQYIPYDCCPRIMSINSPDEFLFGWSLFIPSLEGFHSGSFYKKKKFVGLFSDQFQTSQCVFLYATLNLYKCILMSARKKEDEFLWVFLTMNFTAFVI